MTIWFKNDLVGVWMLCIIKTLSYHTMPSLGNKLKVFVNTMDGKTIPIDVHECDTIWSIKYEIQRKTGFDDFKQRLICETTHLYDGYRVRDYRLRDNDQLQVVVAHGPAWFQESQIQEAKEASQSIAGTRPGLRRRCGADAPSGAVQMRRDAPESHPGNAHESNPNGIPRQNVGHGEADEPNAYGEDIATACPAIRHCYETRKDH